MTATTHVEKVRAAYKAWNDTKGASRALWRELVSDDFEMQSVGVQRDGLSFAGTKTGPDRFDDYLRELIERWEMKYYRVDAIFGDDSRVVMFGECSYDFRGNGQSITTPIANLWTFRDGKAIHCVEVFDSAEAVRVALL